MNHLLDLCDVRAKLGLRYTEWLMVNRHDPVQFLIDNLHRDDVIELVCAFNLALRLTFLADLSCEFKEEPDVQQRLLRRRDRLVPWFRV